MSDYLITKIVFCVLAVLLQVTFVMYAQWKTAGDDEQAAVHRQHTWRMLRYASTAAMLMLVTWAWRF